jgi:hypothetical protein
MKNTYSVRFGGEYTMGAVTLRGGVQLETSSFSSQYLSALTLDSKKLIVSGGIGVRVATGIYLDGVFSFSQMQDQSVRDSLVTQPNPIRPAQNDPNYIGNGDYHMMAFLIGGGIRVKLDERRDDPGRDDRARDDDADAHDEHADHALRVLAHALSATARPSRSPCLRRGLLHSVNAHTTNADVRRQLAAIR